MSVRSLRSWLLRAVAGAALAMAVALPASAQPAFRPEFSVLQLNDVYRIDAVENGTVGGLGRVATVLQSTRAQTKRPVYLLHAGDFIAPSLESRYFSGLQMIDALNFLHRRAPLFVVPGNHEFDEREPRMLSGAVRASNFAWLGSNLSFNTGDAAADRRLQRDTVVTMGGMKIGIFALSFVDSPRGYVGADTAFVTIAEREIEALERRGVDAIVGLTHLDMSIDRKIARLRAAHPKLLWVAGGHEHYSQEEPLSDSTALITKGDSNARRIWRVVFGYRGGAPAVEAEPVVLDAAVRVDAAYQREITDRYRAELQTRIPFFDQQIGTSATPLNASEEAVRNEESSWGNYLTDVMRTAFPDVPADVAVLNGGAIRIDDVVQGPIRWEHLARTFGFPTRVALVWLRGKDLRQTVLEHGVGGDRGEGRFLQLSGARFTFTRQKPVGERVSDVQILEGEEWVPLQENRVYVVAVPDYLYYGGDGYHFKDRAIQVVPPGPDLKLLVFDALTQAYARGTPIAPKVEGRITEVR